MAECLLNVVDFFMATEPRKRLAKKRNIFFRKLIIVFLLQRSDDKEKKFLFKLKN